MTGDLKAERVESRVTFVETRRPLGYDEDDINEVNTDASSESAGKTTRLWLKGHASVLTPKREKCGATLPAAASDFADTKWRDSSSSEKPRSRRLRGDTVDLYKEPSQSLTLASSLEEFAPSNPSSATSSTAADSPEFAGRQNRWRQTARLVANSRGMEAAISILILANCVTMALYIPERPLEAAKEVRFLFTTGWGVIDAADTNATYTAPTTQDADSSGATEETSPMTLLDAADILFTTCFVGELALRIFGQGFIFPRKTAYLRSPWNVVDFCIVSVNFLMLFEVGPNLSAIRLLRIFKVLLMVDRFPGLKNMVSSAVDSVRSLANLGLMLLFIVVMYSIWSLQMWRGQWLYVCVEEATSRLSMMHCAGRNKTSSGLWALTTGRSCSEGFACEDAGEEVRFGGLTSFDSFYTSLLSVIRAVCLSGWSAIMNRSRDSAGLVPAVPFFVGLVSMSNFVVMPLAVIIIKHSFHTTRLGALHRLRNKKSPPQVMQQQTARKLVSPTMSCLNTPLLSTKDPDGDEKTWDTENTSRREVCSPGTRDGESNYRGAIESYPPSEGPQLSPPRGYMQPLINEAGKSSFDNTDPPKPNVEACVTTLSSYKTLQTASLSTRLRLLALSTQEVEGVKPFDGQPAPSFSLKEPSSRDQDTGLPPAEPIVGSPQLPNTNGRWPNPLKRGSSRQEGVQSNGGSPGLAAAELPAASKRPSHAFSASGDGMPPWQFVTASERSLLSNETDDSGHDHGTRRTNQASTDTSVNVSRWLTATAAPLKSDNDLSGTPEPLFRRRSSLHDAVDHTAKAVDRRLGQTGELAFASEKKYPAGTQVPEHRLLSRLNGVVTLLIVLNLATLSAAHYSQPRGLTVVINIVNLATLAFFAVELVVKLWILKAEYFADGFNCIDLASVVVSVASLFLGFFIEASSRSFIIFRAVRTVRVFRALRSFPSISRQAEGVMGAARRSVNMLLMVALFLFTIALLFMHLYGASRQRWLAPQITFSTFPLSLLTSLQVMTGDDWDAIMMESVYQTSAASAVPFVLARFIGDILFTKMFLAVVMEHYEVIQRVAKSATRLLPKRQTMVTRHKQNLESALEQHDKVQPETLASIVSRKALLIPCEYRHTPQLCDAYMQGLLSSTDASGITTAYLANEFRGRELVKAHARGCRAKMTSDGTGLCNLLGWSASVAGLRAVQCKRHLSNDEASFFVFSLSARQWAASITQNQRFDELAAFLAFCSCVTVAVAPAKTIWIVDAMDCSITGFFAVEAMLKSIALGFVKGKGAYLKNGWNVFDFSVLIVSVVSIVFGSLNWQIGIVFRPLRAVRPLRLIKRWKRIRHVAIALIRSLPGLITIVVLVLLIYVLFAIVAVDSLGGQFYVCSLPEVTNRSACQGEGWVQYSGVESIPVELVIDEGEEATPYIKLVAAEWLRLPQHFDHLGAALRTLLVFGTLSKWRALVDTALATCGVENAVGSCAGSNYFAGIMLLTFLLIANFIALPAFTSEVILMYATVRKEMEHTSDYSGRELSYFYMMKLLLLMRPSISLIPRKSRGARLAYRIVTNKWFDNFVGVSILINTITMALEYEGMPDDYAHVLMYVDNSFTFLYATEAVLKLYAVGVSYFKDPWNRFDFLLVTASIVEFAVFVLWGSSHIPINPFLLRSVRAFLRLRKAQRLLRLVKRTKGIQLLFETLFVSISDLWANLFFYGIILTVYALVGVGLFHDVRRLPQGFDHNVNFDNVFSAILTLHRVATGDNWSAMLDNAMVAPPFCSEEVGECGFPTIAPVFFMSFKALSYVVTVVLFIATVLENYRAMSKLSGLKGGMDEIRELHQTWSMLFSDADVIPTQQVQRLLAVMGTEKGPPSFSVPLHYSRCHILDTLSKFQILDHQGKVHFSEVLLEVAFYKVQAVGKGISRREWWSFENDWHRLVPNLRQPVCRWLTRRYTLKHWFAAVFIQRWYRVAETITKMRRLLIGDSTRRSGLSKTRPRSVRATPLIGDLSSDCMRTCRTRDIGVNTDPPDEAGPDKDAFQKSVTANLRKLSSPVLSPCIRPTASSSSVVGSVKEILFSSESSRSSTIQAPQRSTLVAGPHRMDRSGKQQSARGKPFDSEPVTSFRKPAADPSGFTSPLCARSSLVKAPDTECFLNNTQPLFTVGSPASPDTAFSAEGMLQDDTHQLQSATSPALRFDPAPEIVPSSFQCWRPQSIHPPIVESVNNTADRHGLESNPVSQLHKGLRAGLLSLPAIGDPRLRSPPFERPSRRPRSDTCTPTAAPSDLNLILSPSSFRSASLRPGDDRSSLLTAVVRRPHTQTNDAAL